MKKFYLILGFILLGCTIKDKDLAVQNSTSTLEEVIVTSSCLPGMIHVSGKYCTQVIQLCKSYMESPKSTPFARCLEFNKTKCSGKIIEMDFCIDKEEYTVPLDNMPLTNVSWTVAKNICEQENKRLCKEEEWTFACEGEEMYPYTTGYTRPSNICNMDVSKNIICNNKLCDRRASIQENTECKSPFHVHNMSGNVDEWIDVPKYQHSKISDLWMRSSLKGGHWLPVRNRCRPKTDDHDEQFRHISIGFRCCQNI